MGKKTVVVVFGCRYEKEFLGRVDKAIYFVLLQRVDPIFIFTGNDKIIFENKSFDTMSNVINTLEFINKLRINNLDVFIVSSWYHTRRIKFLLERSGMKLPKQNFIRSYTGVKAINIVIEPFAFVAAIFKINRLPFIIAVKRRLGYDV